MEVIPELKDVKAEVEHLTSEVDRLKTENEAYHNAVMRMCEKIRTYRVVLTLITVAVVLVLAAEMVRYVILGNF